MEPVIRALQQDNIRIGFLQEMNLTEGIHTRYSLGYKVWATEADSRHRVRIAIVWREELVSQVEGTMRFGMNMVSFTITAGNKR